MDKQSFVGECFPSKLTCRRGKKAVEQRNNKASASQTPNLELCVCSPNWQWQAIRHCITERQINPESSIADSRLPVSTNNLTASRGAHLVTTAPSPNRPPPSAHAIPNPKSHPGYRATSPRITATSTSLSIPHVNPCSGISATSVLSGALGSGSPGQRMKGPGTGSRQSAVPFRGVGVGGTVFQFDSEEMGGGTRECTYGCGGERGRRRGRGGGR